MKTIAEQIKWDFKTNGSLEIRDKNDKLIYLEHSNGFWVKMEYNSESSLIYCEDSNGLIIDKRPKPCENKKLTKKQINQH